MQRREFLKRCALIAAGVVAADQIDLLEMLAPRRLFTGWTPPQYPVGLLDAIQSTSVHGLQTSIVPNWSVGLSDIGDGGYEVVTTGGALRDLTNLFHHTYA